jgi:hypothetical protein
MPATGTARGANRTRGRKTAEGARSAFAPVSEPGVALEVLEHPGAGLLDQSASHLLA